MTTPNPSPYAVPASALRVFQGFRKSELKPEQFLTALGDTFMPGTAYMLRPLGIAAYVPGVYVGTETGVPDEFALISYRSPESWDLINHLTLRGRVYTQTHTGVYDPRSHADFPVSVDRAVDPLKPYYLAERLTDWQSGDVWAAVMKIEDPSSSALLLKRAARAASSLEQAGFDQCVILPGNSFALVWTHASDASHTAPDWTLFGTEPRILSSLHARRVICDGEPPTVSLLASTLLNFIFVRPPEKFLR